ncbi:ABC transporter permease [Gordonia terrae]|uniref:ABC transporter permease n=2 Tax=Gordonia TaxID=2053 RepID=A0A2I1R402_9ACTN|nr:ABC transporter permease [Gordonia terrae]PKZ63856.1 ABC transporter permease [Gordonia terrae]UPW10084.1 ABC transporter permease [Gordonia terrae]
MTTTQSRPTRGRIVGVTQRAAEVPVGVLDGMGKQLSFYGQSVAAIPRTINRYRLEVLRLLAEVSMGSGALAVIGGTVVIVAMLSVAVGYEVGQQGASSLGRIGLGAFAGFISAFFNTREAIPAIAGIALTATVGAGFTAQLGAMRVSEEIDALETMSIPSLPFLVTTRLIAGTIAVIPLYAVSLIVGYAATQFVTVVLYGQASGTYAHYFSVFLIPKDVLWSAVKVLIMAVVVMCVHCYHGYNARGGPAGVGVAVGRAVRTSLIAVMLIDLLVGLAVYGGPSGAVKVSG